MTMGTSSFGSLDSRARLWPSFKRKKTALWPPRPNEILLFLYFEHIFRSLNGPKMDGFIWLFWSPIDSLLNHVFSFGTFLHTFRTQIFQKSAFFVFSQFLGHPNLVRTKADHPNILALPVFGHKKFIHKVWAKSERSTLKIFTLSVDLPCYHNIVLLYFYLQNNICTFLIFLDYEKQKNQTSKAIW